MARQRNPQEPLQWDNLSSADQRTGAQNVRAYGQHLGDLANKQADSKERQAEKSKPSSAKTQRVAAARMRKAADAIGGVDLTLGRATRNRVSAVEDAATSHRMPHESVAGAGWYFDAHRAVREAAPNLPVHRAIGASSSLSPGARPEDERKALGGIADANEKGSVTMHPRLVQHLESRGVSVPDEVKGKSVKFSDLPGHVVGAMAAPESRASVAKHSRGVEWDRISAVSNPLTLGKAHDVVRGHIEQAQDPSAAPKTWSYTQNQEHSVPGTPEHHEYMDRADDLGKRIRGEVPKGQATLDLYGRHQSNEGPLSNHGHTAEDSWQRSISIDRKHPNLSKSLGDQAPPPKGAVGKGDTSVTAGGVYHAWNNEATRRASVHLQDKHGMDRTVPTTLVQETGWTSTRRRAANEGRGEAGSKDPQWNAHVRSRNAEAKAGADALKADAKPIKGQGKLF
jgi:hypothetical protein